jgi:predicted RNase H-like nuclease (RuvC/YqgF family)
LKSKSSCRAARFQSKKQAMKPTRRRSKPQRRKARARPSRPRSPVKKASRDTVESLQKEVRRLRAARRKLERRLTSAVQEIGMLRQLEFRIQSLENDLDKRDQEIARLRLERADQLSQLELRLGGASIVSTPS